MFTLDKVVPWGRSFDEYQQLFALTPADLERRILGCGDGPAAFNAEATRRGARVVSCDPLFAFSRDDIEARIAATCDTVLSRPAPRRPVRLGHGIVDRHLGGSGAVSVFSRTTTRARRAATSTPAPRFRSRTAASTWPLPPAVPLQRPVRRGVPRVDPRDVPHRPDVRVFRSLDVCARRSSMPASEARAAGGRELVRVP
jgi:hypothetical protein